MKPTSHVHTLNQADVPIARAILLTSAAVALAGALMYMLIPMPLRPGARGSLIAALATTALILGASAWRLTLERLPNAILLTGWVVWAAVGGVCVALGEGFNSLVIGYLLVAMTMLAVLHGLRAALALAAASAALGLALAAAEAFALIPGAVATAQRPLVVRLLSFGLVLTTATVVTVGLVSRHVRELARRSDRIRQLFDRSPVALILHRAGVIIDANPAAATLLGYAGLDALVGRDVLQLFDDAATSRAVEARIAEFESQPLGASLPETRARVRASDGRHLDVQVSTVRVDAEGGPATMSILRDETERLAAESALQRVQQLHQRVVAMSPDLITLADLQTGRLEMANERCLRALGYTSEQLVGHTAAEIGLWRYPGERSAMLDAVRKHGFATDLPATFVTSDGRTLAMRVSASRFTLDDKEYLVVNARDVSSAERERLERDAIFDNASIGIAFTRDQQFVQVNPRFEQMFGWPVGTMAGQRGRVVWLSDDDYADIGRTYGPILASGRSAEIERAMRRRDGSPFVCRMLAKAVDPTHPSHGGTVWIADDVTERRRVEQALAQARDAAEAASLAKSAFLANTSHELRTPLNGLLGLARLVQSGAGDEKRRRQYIDQMVESAQGLSEIIADILDVSKIEAGKLTLEAVAFNLHETVTALHRAYLPLAAARELALTLHIADDVPVVVNGDPVRTRQVLSNFVNNALKFTTAGSVDIAIRRGGDDRVRMEVRDSGPGIDAVTCARLFRPFTQGDESTTRRYGGTGLGLSICRQLAELMGGTVGVESEPGRGSLFWAELPLPPSEDAEPISGFGALSAAALEHTRVLVVEDNPVNMMICTSLLEQHGMRVAQAVDGRQAIDAVEAALREGDPFDVVLMDVQMPVMSGHEATRVLRQRYDARSLPIIALTAAALVSEREQALAAGMNDFLTKPIEPHRLLQAVARALGED